MRETLLVARLAVMPPTIVRDGPFRLFFFSREESRIHVHVAHPDGTVKFWLTPQVARATGEGLDERQIRAAQRAVEAHLERFDMSGSTTSAIEITRVSTTGFALLVGDDELFLPFDQFPWFRDATLSQLTAIEWPTTDHLYWPWLDIDLSIASIRDPGAFPRVSTGDRSLHDRGESPAAN